MEEGSTDGLPVIPATKDSVIAMLHAANLEPETVLAAIPERARVMRAEKVAIAAVMAGCKPAYMPVVAAIIQALGDPRFAMHGPTASTSGMGILTVVNGPIAREIGINGADNAFGPGFRANATIGRAVRLALMNLAGAIPGTLDRSTFGHGGKYTYCIGEREDLADKLLSELRGYTRLDDVVTVMACEAPRQIRDDWSTTAESLLNNIAAAMSVNGTFNLGSTGECVVVIGPEHWHLLQNEGFGKVQIRAALAQRAGRTRQSLEALGYPQERILNRDFIPLVQSDEHILILVAGGDAGRWSLFIPGWTGRASSEAISRRVVEPDICEI